MNSGFKLSLDLNISERPDACDKKDRGIVCVKFAVSLEMPVLSHLRFG